MPFEFVVDIEKDKPNHFEIYTGDYWVRVIHNGQILYEGHDIPNFVWEGILKGLGASVIHEEKSDEWWSANP